MSNPWDRMNGETSRQFAAFTTYRDMGPDDRSMDKTGKALGKTLKLMERWSRANNWVQRAVSWDAEVQRKKDVVFLEEVEAMGRRHAQQALYIGSLIMKPVATLAKKIREAEQEGRRFGDDMTEEGLMRLVGQMVAPLKTLTDMERLAKGQPTERMQVDAGHNPEQDEIAKRIADDPEAGKLANKLLRHITACEE